MKQNGRRSALDSLDGMYDEAGEISNNDFYKELKNLCHKINGFQKFAHEAFPEENDRANEEPF